MVAGEEGLVKVVHPGRHVEILKEPITAGELMSKNPRHCVTRTDVFKNPWIVIKPESVLIPGKVFFLVPNRVVYGLMQSKKHSHQSTNPLQYPSNHTTPPNTTSPHRSFAGVTPKHQSQYHHDHDHNQDHDHQNWPPNNIALIDHDHGTLRQSGIDKITQRRTESESDEEFFSPWRGQRNSYWEYWQSERTEVKGASIKPADTKPNSDHENGGREEDSSGLDSGPSRDQELAGTLKSCLRKPDSARKALRLKVSFELPRREIIKVERPRSASARRARVSDYVNW